MNLNRFAVIAIVGVFVFRAHDACAQTNSQGQGSWSYEIVPYLWAASLEGRVGFGETTADISADFSDLIDFVNVGASMRFFARKPPASWFGEASYVELGSDFDTRIGSGHLSTSQTFAEAGFSYELNDAFSVYGGLRFQGIHTKLSIASQRASDTRNWVDAMAGGQWSPLRSEHWVAWLRGDVGGGSSDLVWLAEAGGGYRWTERWAAYLAYRILGTDYESGGFRYNVRQKGLLLGFGVRF